MRRTRTSMLIIPPRPAWQHVALRYCPKNEGLCCRQGGAMATTNGEAVRQLSREDYENLLAFRSSLRRFLHWSETQARGAGLTPAQHQLMLAVKGHSGA